MREMDAAPSPEVSPAPQAAELSQIDALLPTVYSELRELAEAVLHRCQPIDSVHTTSLIHDVYIRLAERGVRFRDRSHFLCLAARAMRFVLIDRARRNSAAKRGGGLTAITLDDAPISAIDDSRLLAVEDALSRLATFDERKSRIVELRFFGGLSVDETAGAMGLSPATIKREWTLARAWLCREIGDEAPTSD